MSEVWFENPKIAENSLNPIPLATVKRSDGRHSDQNIRPDIKSLGYTLKLLFKASASLQGIPIFSSSASPEWPQFVADIIPEL